MEKYLFKYSNGSKLYHEVKDKFDFIQLLNEIDNNFTQLFKFDQIEKEWQEVTK